MLRMILDQTKVKFVFGSFPVASSASRRVNWEHLPLRRVPAQARSRDKVIRALRAADQIVAADGPSAVSLSSVADRAGLSVGALYQYLPDREAILAALVWRYHDRFEGLLDEVVADARAHPPASDPIDYVIDAVAEIYREEESARSLRASADLPALDAQRAAHRERMAAKLVALLEASGVTSVAEPASPVIAEAAFTAADAVLHEAFAVEEPRRSALIDELRRMMRGYLTQFRPEQADPPSAHPGR